MTDPIGRVKGRYATEPAGKPTAPSVSLVLDVLNKPNLPWGAAKETALYAIHHQDEWQHLTTEDAYEKLRGHHRGVWDDKAARGTRVHTMAQAWCEGQDVDCSHEDAPYLDALERFYMDYAPATVLAERTVIYRQTGLEYGGTPDWLAELSDGRRTWIDLKTGKRYPIDTTLQLAAYRHAEGVAVYNEMGGLESVDPMPESDGAHVLYLHPDGTYEFLPVPANRAAHDTFLHLRRIWTWQQDMTRWEKSCRGERSPREKALA